MGEYFKLVNPSKREYVSAGLGEFNNKIRGLPTSAESRAVVLLTCRAGFLRDAPLAGAWEKDVVLVVGDQGTPPPVGPNIPVAPADGWYWEARGYEDLSASMLASLRGAAAPETWARYRYTPKNITERRRHERLAARNGVVDEPAPEHRMPLARETLAHADDLLFVNPAKWQYLRPAAFAPCGLFDAWYGATDAIAFLTCHSSVLAGRALAASWSGDPVLLVRRDGRYEPRDDGLELKPAAGRSWFDEALASFEDVTYGALALLCDAMPDAADVHAERAAESDAMLAYAGNAVSIGGSTELQRALRERLGPSWLDAYRRALDASVHAPASRR